MWVVPYIEDNEEACTLYKVDEGSFWLRVFDETDPLHKLPMLVCDGAHRREVCTAQDIKKMRCNFLRPTISLAELVSVSAYLNSPSQPSRQPAGQPASQPASQPAK